MALADLTWSTVFSITQKIPAIKVAGYFLTANALLVALKFRLIGNETYAAALDANFLILSCLGLFFLLITCTILDVYLAFASPEIVRIYGNSSAYMDAKRKNVYDEAHFQKVFDSASQEWGSANALSKSNKVCLAIMVSVALLFLFLSLAMLILAISKLPQVLIQHH